MLVIAIGVVLSLLWFWAGWYYLNETIGFSNLLLLLPHEVGQFLVGFFTPLFLLWILIALVYLGRRIGRLGSAPQAATPRAAAPKEPEFRESVYQAPAPSPTPTPAKPDPKAEKKADPAPAPKADTREEPKTEESPKPTSRAQASATMTRHDTSGTATVQKSEDSVEATQGPVKAEARVSGATPPVTPPTAPETPPKASADLPPKRPSEAPARPLEATAEKIAEKIPEKPAEKPAQKTPEKPGGKLEGQLPPKRPADAPLPDAAADPEAPADAPTDGSADRLPGPLPPKRPSGETIAPMPSSAGGTLPPKNPRNQVPGYAAAQGHVLKELNAIAMDIAVLVCDPETYHARCAALEKGEKDSFFSLVRETLERDPSGAKERLRDSGNLDLLETYRAKFGNLVEAAEKEPDGKELISHLESSAAGRLDATIEQKL